jgi:hypothetical protein
MSQIPDLIFGQLIFKGWHRAAAVGNFPGEIAIRMLTGTLC